MSVKDDLYYSEDHEWIREEEDYLLIGITDFAQEELGDIVFVELPEVDEEFDKDDSFGVLESVKAVSDTFIPISGKVIEVNEDLIDNPELINNDPYGDGWLIKVEPADDSELDELLSAEEYAEFIEEE
ncbi:glycine cleavage system protein GcvH [Halanaerobium congolense]|jgi:glycine cleavage system H protein|uniref:Glycine cleavage system H protein n=1 Tax=Halanaerobium congolense TaxID=54121 RepID=A0A1G6ILD6_9FIRM|nr:glycine cleavage system protein GcvH [Halanaerobium congolense]KXS50380.1 MAG: glycine cleavage system H protein [Halanaerobium sp. T82-1]PUU92361.1 MAG: glycine cleavage system H protein [Halanaerobium sp.]PTX15938.1 glycine cleavage system H protein [Halanaerobium congolense]TDP12260.1 glycine cleavage system H protein [Halanaerobium congolense]TDS33865.1 glycine cleavage system H protein [Halanaerobium congolense]